MWTASARHQYRRSGGRYATDVTDAEFALIEPLLPDRAPRRGVGDGGHHDAKQDLAGQAAKVGRLTAALSSNALMVSRVM